VRASAMSSGKEGALPLTHDEFVDGVFKVIHDALEHDEHAKKRQTSLGKANTPVHLRFALGGDDSLYLQAGLSLLHVGGNVSKKLPLAPNALYSADVLAGIRKGIDNARLVDQKAMLKKKDSELQWVADILLQTILSSKLYVYVKAYLDTFDDGFADVYTIIDADDTSSVTKATQLAELPRFKDLLRALFNVVEGDTSLAFKISNAMRAESFSDVDGDHGEALEKLRSMIPVRDVLAVMTGSEATKAPGTTVSDDKGFFEYALRRGIFAMRAPHEQAVAKNHSDSVLKYSVPIAAAAAHRDIDIDDLPFETDNVVGYVKRADRRTVQRAFSALNGNFAMDECAAGDSPSESEIVLSKAKQLRWMPVGTHAHDLTNLAVWEHASARCANVANTNTNLSKDVKSLLLCTSLHFKILQLEPFYRVSCGWQRGDAPPIGTGGKTLITRPTASINGTLAHPRGLLVATIDDLAAANDHDQLTHRSIAATASMSFRNGIQTYYPPLALCESFAQIPTGAGVLRTSLPMRPEGVVDSKKMRLEVYKRLILYGLKYATLEEEIEREDKERKRYAELGMSSATPGASGSAEDRRSGLWNEMKRELAISTDRVWTFVRTLSGLIGEDADSIIMAADESAMRASQEMERQRRAIADRVTQFHARLVETLVSSLLKDSKLQVTTGDDARTSAESLVVIDAETDKQIKDLASGESGRPFFEANVALRALTESTRSKPKSLSDTVAAFSNVVSTLHDSLESELQRPETAGASLGELATPRNSYFVRLRDDTSAAIRSSFDRFTTEFSLRGGRHVYLWELVEGNDHMLSSRFAEFVGHMLVQNRVSTGLSAMYTSRTQLQLNSSQAGISLGKLLNQASKYASSTSAPGFDTTDERNAYFRDAAVNSDKTNWASSAASPFPARRSMLVNRGGWIHGLAY